MPHPRGTSSSPFVLPRVSVSFLSPQDTSWGLAFSVVDGDAAGDREVGGGLTSQATPASSRLLQLCGPWPREGHSPRNSSFPVHRTLSRWMGPFPWPKPPRATAPPLGEGGGRRGIRERRRGEKTGMRERGEGGEREERREDRDEGEEREREERGPG